MQNRWLILFVLFFARTTMAFQFQSIAALSPLLIDSLGLRLVDIGLLIGLYLGPGVIVATLGGTVAAWVGDKRIVSASLILMALGSLILFVAPGLPWLIAGRVMAGIGGVVVNVVMTKMVIDWFAGRNIATAMAIFISSWPLGIALSLVALPALAGFGGLGLAWIGLSVLCFVALALFALLYQPPPDAAVRPDSVSAAALPWTPLLCAALVWALYNTGNAMIFGFGPIILADRGFGVADASASVSLYVFGSVVANALGGWIADRTGRRDTVIAVGLVSGMLLFPAILMVSPALAGVALGVAGLSVGLAAGPIISLPSYVLAPQVRVFGMGIYFSVYYLLMVAAPPVAAIVAERVGDVSVAFVLGAGLMVAAMLALIGFRRTAQDTAQNTAQNTAQQADGVA